MDFLQAFIYLTTIYLWHHHVQRLNNDNLILIEPTNSIMALSGFSGNERYLKKSRIVV